MSSFLKIIENAKRVDLNTKDADGKSYADKLHDDMNSMRKTDEQLSQMHSQGFHSTISKARSVEQRMLDSESDDEFYDELDEPVDTDVDAETQAMLGDELDSLDSDDDTESFVDEDEIDESDYFDSPDEPEEDDITDDDEAVSFSEPDDDDYDDEVEEDFEVESDETNSVDMLEDSNDETSDEVSDISVQTESQESSVSEQEDDDVPDPEPEDISEGDEKDTDGITVDQTVKPVSSVKTAPTNEVSTISQREMVDLVNKLSAENADVIDTLCDMNTFLGRKNAVNMIELDCGIKIPRRCYKLCLDVYHMMNDGDLGESWFESEKTNPLSVWGTALLMFPSDEHVDFMTKHGFDESGHESEEREEKE